MRQRLKFTLLGTVIGIAAIVIWMMTFDPHGGVELSGFLFPISSSLLSSVVFPHESVPVLIWYLGAFFQWFCLG